jgi:hypothetical protein
MPRQSGARVRRAPGPPQAITSHSTLLDTPTEIEPYLFEKREVATVKVLVVEDNVINRKILVRILKSSLVSSTQLVLRGVLQDG